MYRFEERRYRPRRNDYVEKNNPFIEKFFEWRLSSIKNKMDISSRVELQHPSSHSYYDSFQQLILEEARASIENGLAQHVNQFPVRVSEEPSRKGTFHKMQFAGSIPDDHEGSPSMNVLLLFCKVENQQMTLLALAHAKENFLEVEFVLAASNIQQNSKCFKVGSKWKAQYVTCLITFQRMFGACINRSNPDCLPYLLNPAQHAVHRIQPHAAVTPYTDKLNMSQATALSTFLHAQNMITLLQGPPGTGKTSTITTLLQILAKDQRKRVMVTAPSNKAVQVLATRLFERDLSISMLLIGVEGKVTDVLRPILLSTFEIELSKHLQKPIEKLNKLFEKERPPEEDEEALVKQVNKLNLNAQPANINPVKKVCFTSATFRRIQELLDLIIVACMKVSTVYNTYSLSVPTSLESLKDWVDTILRFHRSFNYEQHTIKIYFETIKNAWNDAMQYFASVLQAINSIDENDLLSKSKVLFCTLSVSGRRNLLDTIVKGSIDVLIVDEAGQSVEAETLIPLQHHPKKVLLVGDTKQLPATVLSEHAKEYAYDRSMMQRLEEAGRNNIPIATLTLQYRMHPAICAWPSRQYYGGRLRAHDSVLEHNEENLCRPLAFYDISSGKEQISHGKSRFNEQEANYCVKIVHQLRKNEGKTAQTHRIGIICFYSAQVEHLKQCLNTSKCDANVIVHTVDGFQGDECDIIILSFVCANAKGTIGFLSDVRRLNVAITRAKHHLIMLGHYQTLSRAQGSDVQALVKHLVNEQLRFTENTLRGYLGEEPLAPQEESSRSQPNPPNNQQKKNKHRGRPASAPTPAASTNAPPPPPPLSSADTTILAPQEKSSRSQPNPPNNQQKKNKHRGRPAASAPTLATSTNAPPPPHPLSSADTTTHAPRRRRSQKKQL